MKKPLFILIVCVAMTALIVVAWRLRGDSGSPALSSAGYSVFTGSTAAMPLRFEYPSDWLLKVDAGNIDRYAQVLVEGPRNSAGTLNTMLIVRTAPRSAAGGKHGNAEHLMSDFLSHVYKDLKVLRRRPYQLSGASGFEAEYTHTIPALRKPGLKGRPIDLRTRHLFLERGDLLIEVVLFADRGDFESYRPALDRLLSSFRFTPA